MISLHRNEWRNGWRAVLSGSVGMGTGVGLYTLVAGLFFAPLEQEFDWSRSEIATAGIFGVIVSFLYPLFGKLVDLYGARLVAIAGLFLYGLCCLLMTQVGPSIFSFYAVVTMMAIVGLSTGPLVFSKVVNSCFESDKGIALGITLSGVTFSAIFMLPALSHIIETIGWRWAYVTLGVLPLLIGIPCVFMGLVESPVSTHVESKNTAKNLPANNDKSVKQAAKDSRFWLLLIGLLFANLPIGGMLSQMQPLLNDAGYSLKHASILGSVFALSIAAGRIICGFFLDRFWPAAVAAACLMLPIPGIVLLLTDQDANLVIGAISVMLVGLAQGAEIDFIAFLIPKYFGITHYGAIFGLLAMVVSISIASGAMIFGFAYDMFQGYYEVLVMAIGCYFVASLLILTTGKKSFADPYKEPIQDRV